MEPGQFLGYDFEAGTGGVGARRENPFTAESPEVFSLSNYRLQGSRSELTH